MSTRLFTKIGWQYDTDCRLQRMPTGMALVIAPPLPPVDPYSLVGRCRSSRGKSTRGAFRPCYLRKAVQWMRRIKRSCPLIKNTLQSKGK